MSEIDNWSGRGFYRGDRKAAIADYERLRGPMPAIVLQIKGPPDLDMDALAKELAKGASMSLGIVGGEIAEVTFKQEDLVAQGPYPIWAPPVDESKSALLAKAMAVGGAAARAAEASVVHSAKLMGEVEGGQTVGINRVPAPDFEPGPSRMGRAEAIGSGYTGDQCSNCNSMRMKVSGHCMVCDDCGTTTGCS